MTSDDLLKHSLLLAHGTVYGSAPAFPAPFIGFDGLTPGINNWGNPVHIQDDFPYAAPGPARVFGPLAAGNHPLDVVSWNGDGHVGETALRWWGDCLYLLVHL